MASGGSDIDPRIDMNKLWEDGGVKFMESMLRATGKFHIIPINEAEEENYEEEEEEEEHYDLRGPRGQIPATSTPIGAVPRSYSAQPPSYRPVRPPTPRPNSLRVYDQDISSQNQDISSQNQDISPQVHGNLSKQPSEIPPATHDNLGQYFMPAPMTSFGRTPLSAIDEATENSPQYEHLPPPRPPQPNVTIGGSQYEQLPPSRPPQPNVTFGGSQYEQMHPPRPPEPNVTLSGPRYEQKPQSYPSRRNVTFESSRYEPLPIPHSSQTNIAHGRSMYEKVPPPSSTQSDMMQDTSYGLPPPPYPILKHETVHETPPPQKSYAKQQGYEPDTQFKQFVSCPPPSQMPCKIEQGYQSETKPKQIISGTAPTPPLQRSWKPEPKQDVPVPPAQQNRFQPCHVQHVGRQKQLCDRAPDTFNPGPVQQQKQLYNTAPVSKPEKREDIAYPSSQQLRKGNVLTLPPHSETENNIGFGQHGHYATHIPPLNETGTANPTQHSVKQNVPQADQQRVDDVIHHPHSHFQYPVVQSSAPVIGSSQPNTLSGSFNAADMASMRVPQIPFFSGEDQKGDASFEVWKFELNCLIREGIYPNSLILQAIRKSLRGKSRDNLLTLGENASPSDILNKLEGIYGICSSKEVLLQQFYLVSQFEHESIADYSVRIENLLHRATLGRPIDASVQNEMLCAKLWNGLKDPLLKNSCRFMFETEKNFSRLMKYIRSVEQDLSASAAAKQLSSASNSTDAKASKDAKTAAQSLHATDKSSQKFDNIYNQMKQFREKFKDLEKKFAEASLQAKSSEPSSSPSNPPQQYTSTYPRGRGRRNFRGNGSRGGRGRGLGYDNRRGYDNNRGRGRGGSQQNQNNADTQTSNPSPTSSSLN